MTNPIVSQRKGLEIFRNVRGRLVDRGLLLAVAEIYAIDIVWEYGALVARGKRPEAHELVSDASLDLVAKTHRGGCLA